MFILNNYAHNWLELDRLADDADVGLLKVTQAHIDAGKRYSTQACALAQAAYDYFGPDCRPRVSNKGFAISHALSRRRYRMPIDRYSKMQPKEFDAGAGRAGSMVIDGAAIRIKPCDDTSKRDKTQHAAMAKAWRERTIKRRGPVKPRSWE